MPRSAMNNYSSKPRFGQIVTLQLDAQGKSQKWLAEQCGVTQAHISMVLSGKARPSNYLLYGISNTLHIKSAALINALFEAPQEDQP